ncbi:hypothetical protein BPOR_0074g00190 [Botrytis porri]|uniref:Uncharacterized protein n=1 Tax=Botrytis porri TaxID=87229 RepID=A0A4Z1L085_9HELO|nr:hypothetical protein BPOR_0074g00190 [Botrytis porri]
MVAVHDSNGGDDDYVVVVVLEVDSEEGISSIPYPLNVCAAPMKRNREPSSPPEKEFSKHPWREKFVYSSIVLSQMEIV